MGFHKGELGCVDWAVVKQGEERNEQLMNVTKECLSKTLGFLYKQLFCWIDIAMLESSIIEATTFTGWFGVRDVHFEGPELLGAVLSLVVIVFIAGAVDIITVPGEFCDKPLLLQGMNGLFTEAFALHPFIGITRVLKRTKGPLFASCM